MQRRIRRRSRFIFGAAVLIVAAVGGVACSSGGFQPLTYGAKPWTPPEGWNPQPNPGGQPGCPAGYYIAITSCDGCSAISYALCDGAAFTQCACGGPFWKYPTGPGATCPQNLTCAPDDFPPQNWLEFVDYTGPGWAGLK